MLKCVNLIEIRFYAYLYASSFLVLWDHYADTRSWIRGEIRIHEGKDGYMRANADIWGQIRIFEGKYGYLPWGQITNTEFYLILDMQKRTYCNKIFDKLYYFILYFSYIMGVDCRKKLLTFPMSLIKLYDLN